MKKVSTSLSFLPNRLIFQQPPEAQEQAAEKTMSAEDAQKRVDAAKGDLIELNAELAQRIIERRNEDGGKKFKQWVDEIQTGRQRLVYARQDILTDTLKYLPMQERDIIGKNPDRLVLTRENWKENLDHLMGAVRKLHVFQNIEVKNKEKDPDGAYLSNLDRIAALIQGKSPIEAGHFVENYYTARYNLGKLQRQGYLDQNDVNSLLAIVDKDPVACIGKINELVKKNDQRRAEATLREI